MITILSTLLGFLGSAFPEIFKMFNDRSDKKHELEILKLQMQQAQLGHSQKMEEIGVQADAAFFAAAHQPQQVIGLKWIDGLNASVRPVLAYAFFLLYAGMKGVQVSALDWPLLPWQLSLIWTEEDMAIFCSIVGFYFGSRSLQKMKVK